MVKLIVILFLAGAWSCRGEDPAPAPALPSAEEVRLKRGLELYARFPPPAWGAHVLERRAQQAVPRGGPVSPEEREFIQNYELWDLARRHLERPR